MNASYWGTLERDDRMTGWQESTGAVLCVGKLAVEGQRPKRWEAAEISGIAYDKMW